MAKNLFTSEELLFRYNKKGYTDLFVEGRTDYCFAKYLLESIEQPNDVAIYRVDQVSIDDEDLDKAGLDRGEKGRLVCLAKWFSERPHPSLGQARFFLDKDQDTIAGKLHKYPWLIYTDFSCLEASALCESFLGAVVCVGLKNADFDRSLLLFSLTTSLNTLFALKAACHQGGHNATPVVLSSKYFKIDSDSINLKLDQYFESVLNKNSLWKHKNQLEESLNDYIKKAADHDPRESINGHDYAKVLSIWAKQNCPNVDEPVKDSMSIESQMVVWLASMVVVSDDKMVELRNYMTAQN
ncbi:hypothetical protein OAU50_02775 [Planctomycetota bacterium]|nr:hypothetical protein [Planctomycetota bacterium]